MRAVLLRQFGAPDQLRIEEVPEPQPKDGEALVKVLAAGINASDVKNVAGKMAGTTLPRIPGRDFAGVVASGPRGTEGREVWGSGGDIGFTRDGSHAQFLLIPAAALIDKPARMPMEAAGAGALTFITAWSSLVTGAEIGANDTALILGAAGGVGSAAVQVARFFGATVLAAVRGHEQQEQALQAGANTAIDSSGRNLSDEVRAQTGGRGADVVFDTTGHLFADAIEAAALYGRVCVISAPEDGQAAFNLRSLYRKEMRVLGTDTRRLDVTACAALLDRMAAGFQEGKLRAALPSTYPLERAGEAYANAKKGGRHCLTPQER